MTSEPGARAPMDMPLWKILALIGLQTSAFTLAGWFLWRLAREADADFVTFALWEIGYGLALAGALILASAALAYWSPKLMENLVRAQASTYPFLKDKLRVGPIVFLSLCAGIGEEALFRGGLQTLFGNAMPTALAVILASTLFAAIHFAKPLISALIFAIGCLFGSIYWATGSLLTVMIGHAVYDIYAIWALQEAFHKLGVFDASDGAVLPDAAAHETLAQTQETTGEDS
ncbi:MAG: type II CAAX endopeptidase family protein [Pseudomonadota bacterium]